jgi:hypothetical protein
MRYVGYVACMAKGFVHSFVPGNPNGKTPFGRPRYMWVGNIKTDIQETGWRTRIGPSASGERHMASYCKRGEHLDLIKCAEFVY